MQRARQSRKSGMLAGFLLWARRLRAAFLPARTPQVQCRCWYDGNHLSHVRPREMSGMNSCYFCGKDAHLVCDAFVADAEYCHCNRNICLEHAVPEFRGGLIEQFTLCKDHAHLQND
jgi:hypothetical protein